MHPRQLLQDGTDRLYLPAHVEEQIPADVTGAELHRCLLLCVTSSGLLMSTFLTKPSESTRAGPPPQHRPPARLVWTWVRGVCTGSSLANKLSFLATEARRYRSVLRTVHQGAKAVREVVHDGEMKVTEQDENALKRFHEMPACDANTMKRTCTGRQVLPGCPGQQRDRTKVEL